MIISKEKKQSYYIKNSNLENYVYDENDYLLWTNSDMIYFNDMIENILRFDVIRKRKKMDKFCLYSKKFYNKHIYKWSFKEILYFN